MPTSAQRMSTGATAETARHARTSERTRYFARQIVSAADLTVDQDYFRNKLRRHNRYLHGWGIVCGALVKEAADPWTVLIAPGYILGPYGDEIHIETSRCFDIRSGSIERVTGGECEGTPDPWCSEAPRPVRADQPVYIAVRYREYQARPVRVDSCGCGCQELPCEYSRWRDGYEVRALDQLPATHENPPANEPAVSGPPPECPGCPDDPWVVLAKVTADADGTLTIDMNGVRRQVKAWGSFWWRPTIP